jgi:hypothetical protein
MFRRRSNRKNVAAFLPGKTWLTTGTYFKRRAWAWPSASSQWRTGSWLLLSVDCGRCV